MEPDAILQALRRLAPESLAESWDKVGVQIAGTAERIERAMLCIDLTEAVVEEAIEQDVGLVVAYHPVIFRPLEALTLDEPKQRVVLRAARAGLWVYSPHTALDAVRWGVNDWLAGAFGPGQVRAIRGATGDAAGAEAAEVPGEFPAAAESGQGRVVELSQSMSVGEAAQRVKRHLGVEYVYLAGAAERSAQRVGLCAGAGGSLLEEAGPIDLFFTGEMRHHELLEATARGVAVVLAGHSQTERPYLEVYRKRLDDLLGDQVDWRVSEADQPPGAWGDTR